LLFILIVHQFALRLFQPEARATEVR